MVDRNSDGVALERTGYRDDKLQARIQDVWGGEGLIVTDIAREHLPDSISDRHRQYGRDCPVTNIDCLMYEYDHCEPIALLDFKAKHPTPHDRTSFNARAIANLANRAGIPFYLAYYSNARWSFILDPVNEIAADLLIKHHETAVQMSEVRFVRFLYALRRNGELPPDIAATLCQTI
jgi:hypothetical protein